MFGQGGLGSLRGGRAPWAEVVSEGFLGEVAKALEWSQSLPNRKPRFRASSYTL